MISSVSQKCLLMAVLPILILLGAILLILWQQHESISRNVTEQRLQFFVDPFERLMAHYIIANDQTNINKLVEEVASKHFNDVDFFCVYGKDSSLISSYVRANSKQACPNKIPLDASIKWEDGQYAFIQTFDGEGIRSDFQDRIIGGIYILGPISNISDIHHERWILYSIVILGAFFIGSVLFWFLQRSLIKPLVQLQQGLMVVEKDHTHLFHMKVVSHDEIGQVTESCNKLIDELYHLRNKFDRAIADKVVDIHRAREQADTANKSKSEFLANLSHELRTPVHAIINFSEFLIKEMNTMPKAQAEKYLRNMFASGNRLISLLNNLLDLSKFDLHGVDFDMEDNNLWSIVNIALEELHPLVLEKKIMIQIEKPVIPTMLECDSERVIQVVFNVLNFVFALSSENTTVKIQIEDAKIESIQALAIVIADTNAPLAASEMEKIFEKFSSNALIKSGKGLLSIGLSIAKEIVTSHHGSIGAFANEIGGTTFKIVFPLHQPKKSGELA
ncbi:MAG: HAMP domain-containing histidine kinase [Alphaproteobacteria bacterium]|nr:HAMP domain-containing histidine kinase [Alphaproteobacteria bacterium]